MQWSDWIFLSANKHELLLRSPRSTERICSTYLFPEQKGLHKIPKDLVSYSPLRHNHGILHCNILGVPCNVDLLANSSLTITLGDQVIGEVGLQQPGTGETFYCWLCVSFAIACVSALEKFGKLKAWNSFTNFNQTFLLLCMVNFPQNFLNPSGTWNRGIINVSIFIIQHNIFLPPRLIYRWSEKFQHFQSLSSNSSSTPLSYRRIITL